ncbi:MAG: hypothetical protein K6F96_05740 [Bacteroidales bacterium]|nr:hypothetical protein [Bacteroidales bacterium]
MVSKIQLNQALAESGTRYRETALAMPVVMIHDSIQHMMVVNQLRGKEIQGIIDESGNYKPYKTPWNPSDAAPIKACVLETKHLQYESEFDPESLLKTIYGKPADKIPMITQDMVKKIAVAKMAAISENLCPCIWKGVEDEDSTDTLSNFNGFSTITRQLRSEGMIGLTAGNYVQLGAYNKYNAGVKLQIIWEHRDEHLKKADMFLEEKALTYYNKWYLDQNYNNANMNTDGVQKYLINTEKQCRLVSCYGMEGMGFIYLTDGKKNMRIGIDGVGTGENATGDFILRNGNNVKTVQMFTDCWMGVNFTTVDKRFFSCASYTIEKDSVYATISEEEVSITTASGVAKSVEIGFQGYNLTTATTVIISGTGFSADVESISASDANAEGGKTITVTFQGTADSSGTLRLVNATDDINLTVALEATISA